MPGFLRTSRSARVRALDVRADDGDARDYVFQPSLRLLPATLDHRALAPVLDQGVDGACVGFALATVINVSVGKQPPASVRSRKPDPVSPRMLYEMGRRHDEWHGEHYEGTSLRGAMKGWHKHGVTTERLWPYRPTRPTSAPDREFTAARAADALRRPIGAYFRIVDSDVSHMQAAIAEGDAVLASIWVHDGWSHEHLVGRRSGLPSIARNGKVTGLHAIAIVGYEPRGFILQNSWGPAWGRRGCALLPYDEWFENRQDAWVARPGPTTLSSTGKPQVFVVGFAGASSSSAITAASGLDIDPVVTRHLINTGDRGALSTGGSLVTRPADLPLVAQQALLAPVRPDGGRDIVLYAHGGLNAEGSSARNAARLWKAARERDLCAFFFIWESGMAESLLGWFKSDDDASGPAQFGWADAWERIRAGGGALVRKGQRAVGQALAPIARTAFWNEMKGRASGASQAKGGAALFIRALVAATAATPGARYRIHLVGHSAGAVYLGWLCQRVLRLLPAGNVSLASIHLMAPAISLDRASAAFGATPLPRDRVRVHMLEPDDEDRDSIQIYPSSLLTYVADHLERAGTRVPLLGLRTDHNRTPPAWCTAVRARVSRRHGEFDDEGREIEDVFGWIARDLA